MRKRFDSQSAIRLTQHSRSFAMFAKSGSMHRRRGGVVMDEEYVQEHILTGGIVGPVGGASPTHSWPITAISLGVVASYPTHLRRAPRSTHAWSALRMVAR
jgi:hypothetical protein